MLGTCMHGCMIVQVTERVMYNLLLICLDVATEGEREFSCCSMYRGTYSSILYSLVLSTKPIFCTLLYVSHVFRTLKKLYCMFFRKLNIVFKSNQTHFIDFCK